MPDVPTVISPYRIDIQQGNVVTQEMISKLKPGMTRAQVRFALGSPLVVDPFRTDRWDYVYMLQKQGKETERRNITVIFSEDKLVRVDGDVVALPQSARPADAPAAKAPDAVKPVIKPAAAPAGKPPAALRDQPGRADSVAGGEEAQAAKTESTDASAKSAPAAKAGPQKDKSKDEKGFFGRMMDKIGF
jgi:outer membrane protein assembly factor BamE